MEVSVVYFRAGYEPNHYPSQREWDARWLIERSAAIKCPSIQYHLAGTKKVQQALAKPGVLARFVSDPAQVKAISYIFTGLFSLDDTPEGHAAIAMAINDPERYVLKPQREGGGNNVYGADIPEALNVIVYLFLDILFINRFFTVYIENDSIGKVCMDFNGTHFSAHFSWLYDSSERATTATDC